MRVALARLLAAALISAAIEKVMEAANGHVMHRPRDSLGRPPEGELHRDSVAYLPRPPESPRPPLASPPRGLGALAAAGLDDAAAPECPEYDGAEPLGTVE